MKRYYMLVSGLIAVIFFISGGAQAEEKILKMSTTTSTQASGLLDVSRLHFGQQREHGFGGFQSLKHHEVQRSKTNRPQVLLALHGETIANGSHGVFSRLSEHYAQLAFASSAFNVRPKFSTNTA